MARLGEKEPSVVVRFGVREPTVTVRFGEREPTVMVRLGERERCTAPRLGENELVGFACTNRLHAFADQARATIDHAGVELDQCRAGIDLGGSVSA